jgi:hypothetical protein
MAAVVQNWSQSYNLVFYNSNTSVVVGQNVLQSKRKHFCFQNTLVHSLRCNLHTILGLAPEGIFKRIFAPA